MCMAKCAILRFLAVPVWMIILFLRHKIMIFLCFLMLKKIQQVKCCCCCCIISILLGELPLMGTFFCPQQAACTAQRVYYLALVAATTSASTQLYARSYRPTDAAPLQFANDMKMSFEPHSGVLSWQALATCKEYNADKTECKQLDAIANARYRVMYTIVNDTCNVAAVCGHRCSNTKVLEWTTNTVVTLPFFGDHEYAYRIGMYSDSVSYPLEAQQR